VEPITITFEASAKRHYQAVRDIQKNMASLRRIHWAIFILYVLFVALDATIWVATGQSEFYGPVGWITLGASMVAIFIFVRLVQRWHVKMQFKSSPASQGLMSYEMSENGFQVTGEKFQTIYTWDSVTRLHRTDNFVLFYISASGAYFIPTDLVSNDTFNQIQKWREEGK
jgi:hypothetical protein